MGMFDYVNYEAPCLQCGHPLTSADFQSKDHTCTMKVVKPKKVRQFYAVCPQCKYWNEYRVEVTITATVPTRPWRTTTYKGDQ